MERFTVIKPLLFSHPEHVTVPDSWILWKSCDQLTYCIAKCPENPSQSHYLDTSRANYVKYWYYLLGVIKGESMTKDDALLWMANNCNLTDSVVPGVKVPEPTMRRDSINSSFYDEHSPGAEKLQMSNLCQKTDKSKPNTGPCGGRMSNKRPQSEELNGATNNKMAKLETTATPNNLIDYHNQPSCSKKHGAIINENKGMEQSPYSKTKSHILPDLMATSSFSSKRSKDRELLAGKETSQSLSVSEKYEEKPQEKESNKSDHTTSKHHETIKSESTFTYELPKGIKLKPDSNETTKESAGIFNKLSSVVGNISPNMHRMHFLNNTEPETFNSGPVGVHQMLIDLTNKNKDIKKSQQLFTEYTKACQQVSNNLEVYIQKLRELGTRDFDRCEAIARWALQQVQGSGH